MPDGAAGALRCERLHVVAHTHEKDDNGGSDPLPHHQGRHHAPVCVSTTSDTPNSTNTMAAANARLWKGDFVSAKQANAIPIAIQMPASTKLAVLKNELVCRFMIELQQHS